MSLDALAQAAQNYDPAAHIPPPPPLATLAISPNGFLRLHTSIREQLGLRHGQPINLIPPTFGSLFWHLDIRPSARRRTVWYNGTGMRAEGIALPPDLVKEPLLLYLMPGEPAHPGYYPLLPANALAA